MPRIAARLVIAICTLALVAAAAGSALAAKKGGVSMPNSVKVGDKSLVLNGLGVREATVFNVDVYVAGLYLEAKTKSAKDIINSGDKAKRLVMKFVRDVDASDMHEAFDDGFKKNAGGKMGALKKRVGKFKKMVPSLKNGNSVTLTYVPGTGTEVRFGKKVKGTIEGEDFAKVLFAIWLGPSPPNSGLKKGMLGK